MVHECTGTSNLAYTMHYEQVYTRFDINAHTKMSAAPLKKTR